MYFNLVELIDLFNINRI